LKAKDKKEEDVDVQTGICYMNGILDAIQVTYEQFLYQPEKQEHHQVTFAINKDAFSFIRKTISMQYLLHYLGFSDSSEI
jgi:hypothetical protein